MKKEDINEVLNLRDILSMQEDCIGQKSCPVTEIKKKDNKTRKLT